jgi:hypothetical protein
MAAVAESVKVGEKKRRAEESGELWSCELGCRAEAKLLS